jgi:hypothetical protein
MGVLTLVMAPKRGVVRVVSCNEGLSHADVEVNDASDRVSGHCESDLGLFSQFRRDFRQPGELGGNPGEPDQRGPLSVRDCCARPQGC